MLQGRRVKGRRVAADYDEGMVATDDLKSRIILAKFGKRIPAKFCRANRITQFLTVSEYKLLQQLASGWEYGLEVEFIPGACENIKQLQDEDCIVDVVTKRDGELLEVARERVRRAGMSMEFVGVGYANSKRSVLRLRGYDYFIDNELNNLIDAAGVVSRRCLLSRPGNMDELVPEGIVRVPCWCAFHDYIKAEMDGIAIEPSTLVRAATC